MDNVDQYVDRAAREAKKNGTRNCILCFNLRYHGKFNALICDDAPEDSLPYEFWHRVTSRGYSKMTKVAEDCPKYETEQEETINAIAEN